MITRLEIDGFKSFETFELDLQPFTAIVGPNASGKSNLFDAIKFLARLSQTDVRSAMNELRGEPEELFRVTPSKIVDDIRFAVEVLLEPKGKDAFGTAYEITSSRIRYEVAVQLRRSREGRILGIFVTDEKCAPILKRDDRAKFARAW
jgi:predicted ATPase